MLRVLGLEGRLALVLLPLLGLAAPLAGAAADASAAAGGYSGFIRISNERFADDACREFLPLGLNACALCGDSCCSSKYVRTLSPCLHTAPRHHDWLVTVLSAVLEMTVRVCADGK